MGITLIDVGRLDDKPYVDRDPFIPPRLLFDGYIFFSQLTATVIPLSTRRAVEGNEFQGGEIDS